MPSKKPPPMLPGARQVPPAGSGSFTGKEVPPAFRRPERPRPAGPETFGVDLRPSGLRPQDRRTKRQADPRAALLALAADEDQRTPEGRASDWLEEAGRSAVAATYSFQAPDGGGRYGIAVRFVGVRKNVDETPGVGDFFDRVERIDGLVADGRAVSITTRATGIHAGEWRILAQPFESSGAMAEALPPRRVIDAGARFEQLAQGPGVHVAAWPTLIALGAGLAILLQGLLAARESLSVVTVLLLSLAGCAFGFVGGKLWYLGLHHKPLSAFLHSGACIQGFLLGALLVLGLGALWLDLPIGAVLDVSTPGIFLGVAVGRPGCFLTGCCAGRPTGSHWGLVSSDRRLRVRRFPVQLFEAGVGLAIGLAALGLMLLAPPERPGAVFLASIAGYILARQLLFPLRVESRTRGGRLATMAASAAVLAGTLLAIGT